MHCEVTLLICSIQRLIQMSCNTGSCVECRQQLLEKVGSPPPPAKLMTYQREGCDGQSLPNAWPTLNAWLASDTWLIHQWLTFTIELLKIKSSSSMSWNRAKRGVCSPARFFSSVSGVKVWNYSETCACLVCFRNCYSSSATPVLFSEFLNCFACLFLHINDFTHFSVDSGGRCRHPVGKLVVQACTFVLKAGYRKMPHILNTVNLCLNTVVCRMHGMAIRQLLSLG